MKRAIIFAPMARLEFAPSIHKIPLKRFRKYGLHYSIEPNAIHVTAVFHGSRSPDELQRRLA